MRPSRFIYLDHAASTPVDPQVLQAMLPYFTETYGNPHGMHQQGRASHKAINQARRTLARRLNCRPKELVFTSGGTESDNMAVRGIAWAQRQAGRGKHIITTAVEHAAVSKTVAQLCEDHKFEATYLPVDSTGKVQPGDVEAAIRPDTVLISVMAANNEVGTLQPLQEIGEIARAQGIPFHSDSVQAVGVVDFDLKTFPVDALAFSGHKFYGPKGVGLLYLREGTPFIPHSTGGSHEENRRPGTENVPLIVGLAAAMSASLDHAAETQNHLVALRDRLIDGLLTNVEGVYLTGHRRERLPNHASFVFAGCDATTLLMHLDLARIGAASGSACATGNPEPSPVLLAMGTEPALALGALRLTLGQQTTAADIDYVVQTLPGVVEKVRQLSTQKMKQGLPA